jgi:hypothetical protein
MDGRQRGGTLDKDQLLNLPIERAEATWTRSGCQRRERTRVVRCEQGSTGASITKTVYRADAPLGAAAVPRQATHTQKGGGVDVTAAGTGAGGSCGTVVAGGIAVGGARLPNVGAACCSKVPGPGNGAAVAAMTSAMSVNAPAPAEELLTST